MSRPQGSLERSLEMLTIGVQRGRAERRRALVDTTTGEYEQPIHVDMSGRAANGWGSFDLDIGWELPFVYAPLQRRVPFKTPHFTQGVEITSGQGTLVTVLPHVIRWTVNDSGWHIGATVRFAVCAPNATDLTPFSAVAHLSFVGFATMAETTEFA